MATDQNAAQKMVDATHHTQIRVGREKLNADNAGMANKTNVYQSIDQANPAAQDGAHIDMGDGNDVFHFGNYGRGNNDFKAAHDDMEIFLGSIDENGELGAHTDKNGDEIENSGQVFVVDMGGRDRGEDAYLVAGKQSEANAVVNAYEAEYAPIARDAGLSPGQVDFVVPKWLTMDNDIVSLGGSLENFMVRINFETGGIQVHNTVSGLTIEFLNVERFKADGIKYTTEEFIGLFNFDVDNLDTTSNVFVGVHDDYATKANAEAMREAPNHLSYAEAIRIAEGDRSEAATKAYVERDGWGNGNEAGAETSGSLELGGGMDRFHFGESTAGREGYTLRIAMGDEFARDEHGDVIRDKDGNKVEEMTESGEVETIDTVVLHGTVEDYAFSVYDHDGKDIIRIDRLNENGQEDGHSVIMHRAEKYVFNNVKDVEIQGDDRSINFANDTFTHEELLLAARYFADDDNEVLSVTETGTDLDFDVDTGLQVFLVDTMDDILL